MGSFFNQYLDTGGDGGQSQEREVSERPSFEKFLSSPSGLTEHLAWQLSVTICSETVKELAESIIGNLDENGYLTRVGGRVSQNGKYSQDDLDDALAVVQDFDPIGVGARDLRECLLLQIKAFDPTEYVGAANCFRTFEAGAVQPAEGSGARSESARWKW